MPAAHDDMRLYSEQHVRWLASLSAEAREVALAEPGAASPSGQLSQWHLVVVPEVGDPEVTSFDAIDPLQELLCELDGQDVSCFIFFGYRALFTAKPFRRLLLPNGKQLPLYVQPEVQAVDASGFMGDSETRDLDETPAPTRDEEGEYEEDYVDDEDADVDEEPG